MAFPVEDWKILLSIAAFIIFILLDIWKAYSKIAHWIPGKVVIVTGLTIQMLRVFDVVYSSDDSEDQLIANQLKIEADRLSMCILAACLLPGMAKSGSTTRYFNIVAIFGSLAAHIATEAIAIMKRKTHLPQEKQWWGYIISHRGQWWSFVASDGIMLIAIAFFGVFITLVVLAGETIRESLAERIPVILSNNINESESLPCGDDPWEDFQVEIIKTRIVARSCQPEYVFARSLCSTIAGLIVFVYDVVFVVKMVLLRFALEGDGGRLRSVNFYLHCFFILIGSGVVMYRALMAMCYFSGNSSQRAKEFAFIEIFASSTQVNQLLFSYWPMIWNVKRQLLGMYIRFSLCIPSGRPRKVVLRSLGILSTLIFRIPYLVLFFSMKLIFIVLKGGLYAGTNIVFYFSILCWRLSSMMAFRNMFLGRFFFRDDMSLWDTVPTDTQFLKYRQALEHICMPGEDPVSLWIADRRCLNQTQVQMYEAYTRGNRYDEVISVVSPSNAVVEHGPGMFMKKLEELRITHIKGYIPGLTEPLWRLTAESIVTVIIKVQKAAFYTEKQGFAMNVYSQARDLLDFVDSTEKAVLDPVYKLAGKYSTQEFAFLQEVSTQPSLLRRLYSYCKSKLVSRGPLLKPLLPPETTALKDAIKCIDKLCEKSEKVLIGEHILGESLQAQAGYADRCVEPSYSMYLVCKLILNYNYESVKELMDGLYDILGDVIRCCLLEVPDLLVKSCRSWAANFEEEK